MADFARWLPLSSKPTADESGVTGDWRADAARQLDALARSIEACDAEAWIAPVAARAEDRTGVTDTVSRLVARCESPRRFRSPGVGRGPALDSVAASRRLRAVAEDRRSERGPRGIREVADIVGVRLRVAGPLGSPHPIPEPLAGAIALHRALTAPLAIRAVVRGRTVRSADAGWAFGTGPVLTGSTAQLLDFLYGTGPVPS